MESPLGFGTARSRRAAISLVITGPLVCSVLAGFGMIERLNPCFDVSDCQPVPLWRGLLAGVIFVGTLVGYGSIAPLIVIGIPWWLISRWQRTRGVSAD